jgi:hypothetical protein
VGREKRVQTALGKIQMCSDVGWRSGLVENLDSPIYERKHLSKLRLQVFAPRSHVPVSRLANVSG